MLLYLLLFERQEKNAEYFTQTNLNLTHYMVEVHYICMDIPLLHGFCGVNGKSSASVLASTLYYYYD